ncbi:MAG TPA: hypothetical protein PLK71_01130 [Candidatus Paceibacterota bacterium]|nr:hypothetical protein [Candidatus Paceibacterota bacterium]HPN89419.1 hypothetical protein [Candidatus Paceibacterota bacterium]
MKHALMMLAIVLAVGGCATMGPMPGQIVSAGPVSGPCPQCGQGITVPANGVTLCPSCGNSVRLAQPAPVARPSVVFPQVVTVVTGGGRSGGHHRSGGYGHYGWRPPRPVGVPVPIYRSGGYYGAPHYGWNCPRPVGVPVPIYR